MLTLFIHLLTCFRWTIDVLICRFKIKPRKNNITLLEKKYLILLPHADDELIGCDRLLKSDVDCMLINMDMLGGDDVIMHARRYEELKKYTDSINRRLLSLTLYNKESQLKSVIEDFQPNVICVPSFFDWHEDHFQVMTCLHKALLMMPEMYTRVSIAMYQVSVPLHPDYINFAIPMSKSSYKDKWNSFNTFYKSQHFLPIERFGSNERINGKLVSSYAAESYILLPVNEWQEMDLMRNNVEMQNLLKVNINKLSTIRKYMRPYYKLFFHR